jgi:mutual gliding-motility protein MglA
MATINYALREISVKIVYYGTGLCGKTTNLQVIHRKVPTEFKSDMVSLATETDRTLFFDFLPLDLGKIKGFSTKFQLYTVPGQVYYNATRKLVLRGVDGVVFVVDSAPEKIQENIDSFKNLEENLAEYGYQRENIPIIIQYNKRDIANAVPVEKLNSLINRYGLPWNEAIALQGKGIFESLKMMGKMVIDNLNKKYSRSSASTPAANPSPSQPDQFGSPSRTDSFQQRQGGAPQPRQQTPARPQPSPWRQPIPPMPGSQPSNDSFRDIPLQQREAPPQRQKPPAAPTFSPPPAKPQSSTMPGGGDYYDYSSIDLEPIEQPPQQRMTDENVSAGDQNQSPSSIDKTDLDLEIERYQREIEEKQRRQRPQAQKPPMSQQQPQQAAQYDDVYEVSAPSEDQMQPYQSPGTPDQSGDQPLYFTSVNTDRQRKKMKRPVNPKTKPQGGLFSKFFNKDNP